MKLTCCVRLALILYLSITGLTVSSTSLKGEELSLCDIAASPVTYQGHVVTLRARIHSGGMHGWYIADVRCKQFGVALFMPKDAQGIEDFYKSVNFVGMEEHPVYASFTGWFQIQNTGETPPRILRVQTMRGFSSQSESAK